MKTPKLTYAVSLWSYVSQMPACLEHVEARNDDEAWDLARTLAASHGPGYRVQWVRLFEGCIRNVKKGAA